VAELDALLPCVCWKIYQPPHHHHHYHPHRAWTIMSRSREWIWILNVSAINDSHAPSSKPSLSWQHSQCNHYTQCLLFCQRSAGRRCWSQWERLLADPSDYVTRRLCTVESSRGRVAVIDFKSMDSHTKIAFETPKQRRLNKSCLELCYYYVLLLCRQTMRAFRGV